MVRLPLGVLFAGLGALALVFLSCTSPAADGPSGTPPVERAAEPAGTPAEAAPDSAAAGNAAAILESFYGDDVDSAAALAALEKAGVDTMDSESRLVYAVLLRNEGRMDEARTALESVVAEDPGNAVAWFNLALVEHAAGDRTALNAALDTALKTDPALAEAWAFRGNLAVSESDWPRAEANLKRALELQPDSVESLVGLAWVMAKTERIADALPLLDRAVGIDPDFVYARVDRSRVNVALRHYNEAERDLDAAISLEPDVPWHYLDRARIRLRHFKDYEGALSDLETVERLDPGNFFALVYLAGLHDEQRRFESSESYYLRVIETRPDYVWAYLPLGKFAYMKGEYRNAAIWFAKASAEDPDEFTFALMAGISSLRAGNTRDADRIMSDVLRKFRQGQTQYEVVRFCVERNSDYYAVNALNKETDTALRERLWFYLGAVYSHSGNSSAAAAVNQRLAGRTGEMEYDIAWAALNGMGG